VGGLPRRAGFAKSFLRHNPGALIFQADAGGVFDPKQREPEKEPIIWQALGEIGLDLLNLVPTDAAALARLTRRGQEIAVHSQPQLVTANVFGPGRRRLAPAYVVRRAADGTRLVFVGICEPHSGERLGYVVENPKEALASLLPVITTKDAVVILLAYMPTASAREVATAIKGLAIVIAGDENGIAAQPYRRSGIWILQTHSGGRYVGWVGLHFSAPGQLLSLDPQRIFPLDASVPDDPQVALLLEQSRKRPRTLQR